MNDPSHSEDGLMEDLQAEYMELVGKGDSRAFDFLQENSDAANRAIKNLGMGLMKAAGADMTRQKEGARAPALALWALCERQSFLDVIEREVAPMWAQHELPKRIAEFEDMREEQNQELVW